MAEINIDINVNDEAFTAFLEKLEKYKESLKNIPLAWQETISVIDTLSEKLDRIITASELASESIKNVKEDIDKVQSSQAKFSSASTSSVNSWKRISNHSKDTSKNIFGIVNVLGRISGLPSLSGLSGTLGVFGGILGGLEIDKLANSVAQGQQKNRELGITSGERVSTEINLGRFIDPSILGRIADIQNNLQEQWRFGVLGVKNPEQKDPVQILQEIIPKIKNLWDTGHRTLQDLQRSGLNNIIGLPDFRRIGNAPVKEILDQLNKSRQEAPEFAISPKIQSDWQELDTQLERTTAEFKKLTVEGLDPLAVGLTRFLKDMEEVGKGIKDLIYGWISLLNPKAHTPLPGFSGAKDGKRVGINPDEDNAKFIDNILKFLHITSSSPTTTSTNTPTNAPSSPSILSRMENFFGLGENSAVSPSSDKAKEALQFFMGKEGGGWSREQAAGIIANIATESKFKSNAVGDSGLAYGIGQWHPDRQAEFKRIFGHDIRKSTYEEQLSFYNMELQGLTKDTLAAKAGKLLKQSPSARESGAIVSQFGERPRDVYGEMARRGAQAEVYAASPISQSSQTAANQNNNLTPNANRINIHINNPAGADVQTSVNQLSVM